MTTRPLLEILMPTEEELAAMRVRRKARERADKTSMAYWFPKIEAAGLPVPKTIMFDMPEDVEAAIWEIFDCKEGVVVPPGFFERVTSAATELGFPCFIRTSHTSGKHNWDKSCFVKSPDDIRGHMLEIAYFAECVGAGPWETWAVRELLPTIPYGVCPRYGNMPICKEFRFFVEDGEIKCAHPYWPLFSLEEGGADLAALNFEALCRMENEAELSALASAAGRAVGGAWSVDLLETKRGWFVTDMAEAGRSWHWPECTRAESTNDD